MLHILLFGGILFHGSTTTSETKLKTSVMVPAANTNIIPLEIISRGWIVNKVYSYRPNSFQYCHCSANLEVPELGERRKIIYMMFVQKNTLSHCILVFETCLIRTLCSKVTAGPTCESSNVLPQGCDEFSGPLILYYLKMW